MILDQVKKKNKLQSINKIIKKFYQILKKIQHPIIEVLNNQIYTQDMF